MKLGPPCSWRVLVFAIGAAIAAARPMAVAQVQTAAPPAIASTQDVMRATEHGMRLTARFADTLVLACVRDALSAELDLTPEQEQRFCKGIGDRVVMLVNQNAAASEQFGQNMVEMVLHHQAWPDEKLAPEKLEAIADARRALMPALRELIEGVVSEGRAVLDEPQLKDLKRLLASRETICAQVDQMLERWSHGDIKRLDDPMEEFVRS